MSAKRNRNNKGMTDLQNSLLLYPSKGPGLLAIQEKLIGTWNYRSWRREVEIGLATKRKLGFFKELLRDDPVKADMLDTYNSMVIVWLTNSMTDSITKSMVFLNSALNIWIQLERRFSLSNGSRKYQINKEIYSFKQNHSLVNDYYATFEVFIRGTGINESTTSDHNHYDEIKAFIEVMNQQQEEQRLFHFLNGLDEVYRSQRSQTLLMTLLPIVEMAFPIL